MRLNSHTLALVAVATGAVLPSAASARPLPETVVTSPDHGGAVCAKDYSKNSAGGDYCPATRSSQPISAASIESPAPPVVKADESFSWADASAGAGGMLALVALSGGGMILVRRRHESSGAHRSPATS